MTHIKLTDKEKDRIAQIRAALKRMKNEGYGIRSWESTFFLGIIDRYSKGAKRK